MVVLAAHHAPPIEQSWQPARTHNARYRAAHAEQIGSYALSVDWLIDLVRFGIVRGDGRLVRVAGVETRGESEGLHEVLVSYARFVAGLDFTDDAVLVKALTARDVDAFGFLLDRYHAPLVRLACQYVPSRAVAEEVVQETWLAVIQGIDRFEGRSSVKTWLFAILVNIARSRGVKEQRSIPFSATLTVGDEPAVDPSRFRRFRKAGTWREPPDPWPDPERQAVVREELDVVEAAIDGLADAQREVITLRDVLGCSAAEVCEMLGVSEGNQRVLLHRARSKVRAAVERHYGGGERR
jgi:RNA polymerase sigma-70 factor (ECF subfamily)